MSKTVVTNTSVALSGDNWGGAPLFSESLTNASGLPPSSIALAPGNNTVAVPAAATGVVLVPPAGSTNAKVLKGANADTGIALDPAYSTRLKFVAGGVASFVLSSAGSETVSLVWT